MKDAPPVPNKKTDTQEEFARKANAFMKWERQFLAEFDALARELTEKT